MGDVFMVAMAGCMVGLSLAALVASAIAGHWVWVIIDVFFIALWIYVGRAHAQAISRAVKR